MICSWPSSTPVWLRAEVSALFGAGRRGGQQAAEDVVDVLQPLAAYTKIPLQVDQGRDGPSGSGIAVLAGSGCTRAWPRGPSSWKFPWRECRRSPGTRSSGRGVVSSPSSSPEAPSPRMARQSQNSPAVRSRAVAAQSPGCPAYPEEPVGSGWQFSWYADLAGILFWIVARFSTMYWTTSSSLSCSSSKAGLRPSSGVVRRSIV